MPRILPSPDSRRWIAAVAATVLLTGATALAQEQQVAPKPVPVIETTLIAPSAPTAAEPASPTTAPAPAMKARPLSPMMAEMQAVIAAENEQLAELQKGMKAAATPDDALALQRRIEQVKFDTEISLLRVQAKHARQAGRTQVASRIDSAIAELLNPPKLAAPAARPVPTRENQSR